MNIYHNTIKLFREQFNCQTTIGEKCRTYASISTDFMGKHNFHLSVSNIEWNERVPANCKEVDSYEAFWQEQMHQTLSETIYAVYVKVGSLYDDTSCSTYTLQKFLFIYTSHYDYNLVAESMYQQVNKIIYDREDWDYLSDDEHWVTICIIPNGSVILEPAIIEGVEIPADTPDSLSVIVRGFSDWSNITMSEWQHLKTVPLVKKGESLNDNLYECLESVLPNWETEVIVVILDGGLIYKYRKIIVARDHLSETDKNNLETDLLKLYNRHSDDSEKVAILFMKLV